MKTKSGFVQQLKFSTGSDWEYDDIRQSERRTYVLFKQYPNVTFYRVVIPKEKMESLSEEVSEVAAWSDIDNIMHIDVNDLWKMLDK